MGNKNSSKTKNKSKWISLSQSLYLLWPQENPKLVSIDNHIVIMFGSGDSGNQSAVLMQSKNAKTFKQTIDYIS